MTSRMDRVHGAGASMVCRGLQCVNIRSVRRVTCAHQTSMVPRLDLLISESTTAAVSIAVMLLLSKVFSPLFLLVL